MHLDVLLVTRDLRRALSLRTPFAWGTPSYRFDEAHRRIAKVLGWDGLPSPASAIQSTSEGVIVIGTGQGHRVGLCLKGCCSRWGREKPAWSRTLIHAGTVWDYLTRASLSLSLWRGVPGLRTQNSSRERMPPTNLLRKTMAFRVGRFGTLFSSRKV